MRALLDTNIIIHREASKVVNQDIGILFKWLDKVKYIKCIHPLTIEEIRKNPNKTTVETFNIKLSSYEVLKTIVPNNEAITKLSDAFDNTENDRLDSKLLNEVYSGRVDILVSEDKKIHTKAGFLGISDKVFTINSFLEKIVSENPTLIDYKVLNIRQEYFGNLNIDDAFFNSLKEDYPEFFKWFNSKADEKAYVSYNNDKLQAFLYLKVEDKSENYGDIAPVFEKKKRLKIGTFKVVSNGERLSERFIKIVFDNALRYKVDEIYVTIFDKRIEQKMLINLFEEWGFVYHGLKGEELVYVRKFNPTFNITNPKLSYPFISKNSNVFLIPIYPEYHTELFPDSYLKTESLDDLKEDEPHRNAISKVYICRSIEREVKTGDVLVFYRTAPTGKSAYYHSVITTIGIVEEKIDGITDKKEFILKCRKRSIFTDNQLSEFWNYNTKFRPFIIKFLYICSFTIGNRLNRKTLLDLGILSGSDNEIRGLKKITKTQFEIIIKETKTNESIIIN